MWGHFYSRGNVHFLHIPNLLNFTSFYTVYNMCRVQVQAQLHITQTTDNVPQKTKHKLRSKQTIFLIDSKPWKY